MLERHGLSNGEDFTPITALPLLLGETTFSYQHPPTLLRRKAQFIDAQSTATVPCIDGAAWRVAADPYNAGATGIYRTLSS